MEPFQRMSNFEKTTLNVMGKNGLFAVPSKIFSKSTRIRRMNSIRALKKALHKDN
jgi:hypothetical protein